MEGGRGGAGGSFPLTPLKRIRLGRNKKMLIWREELIVQL